MSSLDDFFAKKDRKKSATKTNLLAADELYRTLEETTKLPQEVESSEKLQLDVVTNQHAALEFGIRFSDEVIDEEDEWCDFTEEHDQPFPNLKRNSKLVLSAGSVSNVVASSKEVKLDTGCPYQDTGGDGLGVGPSTDELSKPTCPWLKLVLNEQTSASPKATESQPQLELQLPAQLQLHAAQSQQQQSPSPSPSLSPSQSQSSPPSLSPSTVKSQPNMTPKKQVYVPPALRQSQCDFRPGKQTPPVSVKLAKGQAPDLNNVDFFPSLCQSRISKRAK